MEIRTDRKDKMCLQVVRSVVHMWLCDMLIEERDSFCAGRFTDLVT